MSSESIGGGGREGVDWRRAEFVLTLLAVIGFITLPIRITTIYSGLPAHPLFVHVPVVLIPTTVIAAVVFMVKREWFSRYGIALAVVSIVAMSSIFLTMQAGAALRAALNLQGQAAKLISEHSQAAHILAYVYVAFTATLIVTFAAQRISGGDANGPWHRRPPALPQAGVHGAARRARAAVDRRRLHVLQDGRPRCEGGVGGTDSGRPRRFPARSGRTRTLFAVEQRRALAGAHRSVATMLSIGARFRQRRCPCLLADVAGGSQPWAQHLRNGPSRKRLAEHSRHACFAMAEAVAGGADADCCWCPQQRSALEPRVHPLLARSNRATRAHVGSGYSGATSSSSASMTPARRERRYRPD